VLSAIAFYIWRNILEADPQLDAVFCMQGKFQNFASKGFEGYFRH
jgi:hypothetical protein